MARPFGSKDKKPRQRGWNNAQLVFLKQNFYTMSWTNLAQYIGKSTKAIKVVAKELGLYKFGYSNVKITLEDAIGQYNNIGGTYFIVCDARVFIGYSQNIGKHVMRMRNALMCNKYENSTMQQDWNTGGQFYFILHDRCDDDNVRQIVASTLINKLWNTQLLYNTYKIDGLKYKDFTQDNIELFWSHVDIKDTHGCWKWLGEVDHDGYGQIQFNNRVWRAHRLSFLFSNKSIESNLLICHRCHNKLCCNPIHLYNGSTVQNSNDYIRKPTYSLYNKDQTLIQWSREQICEVPYSTLYSRMQRGWSLERALKR